MTTLEPLPEPPITPEVRKWLEWHIQDLGKSASYWLKRTNEFGPDKQGAKDECFGRYFALDNEATGLNFQLYMLDHPNLGDVSNKHEWE